jgi:hypothetical protein
MLSKFCAKGLPRDSPDEIGQQMPENFPTIQSEREVGLVLELGKHGITQIADDIPAGNHPDGRLAKGAFRDEVSIDTGEPFGMVDRRVHCREAILYILPQGSGVSHSLFFRFVTRCDFPDLAIIFSNHFLNEMGSIFIPKSANHSSTGVHLVRIFLCNGNDIAFEILANGIKIIVECARLRRSP